MILYPVSPVRNLSIASMVALQIFQPEDCQRLIDAANPERWEEGQVGVLDERRTNYGREAQARSMRQQLLPVFKDAFPLNVVAQAVSDANSERWRFELTGFVTEDRPWLMRYEGGRKDHFDWHVDLGQSVNASRKLAFSIQLSDEKDYEGGDLEFLNVRFEQAALRKRGTMVLFPAFWTHRVTPTTRGVRYAAVGWVHGPSFR